MKCGTLIPLLVCICGISSAQSRVINAGNAVLSPYYAKLTVYTPDYSMFSRGSGTFISRKHILTSATLVGNANQVLVQFGATEFEEMIEIRVYPEIVLAPDYDPETFINDLAVIILPYEVESESIVPARLMRDILQPQDRLGDIVGYGWTPEGTEWRQVETKQSFQSSWIDDEECSELLGDRAEVLSETHFCALDYFRTSSVCHGDEGAGFVMYIDTVHYVTGVLSVFTHMCDPNFPAMYTRVAYYAEWIDYVMSWDQ